MAMPASSDGTVYLTAVPNEVLHEILKWLPPQDLATLPLVCRSLRNFVQGNPKLHLDIYLNVLDKPNGQALNWEAELHDLIRLQKICNSQNVAAKQYDLPFVHDMVVRLLKNASSAPYPLQAGYDSKNTLILADFFKHESNRVAFLQQSSLFDRVYRSHGAQFPRLWLTSEYRHYSAKLHCLYGRPILNVARLRSASTYPYACSQVYDLRNYTELSKWGPFMNDGTATVDWEKVEAIVIVISTNIAVKRIKSLFNNVWDTPFSGSYSHSFKSSATVSLSALDKLDPYGVTGAWYRIVCFLDYNDFFSFNFNPLESVQSGAPRPPIYYGEATRMILMRIHVTKIEKPNEEYHQDYPLVHFKGISRPLDDSWDVNASSDIRGVVGMTHEGEVRWTTYSIFHAEERWKSEGIQIGGLRSARGIVGNWFDSEYDPHGPCGPTAFWKASDDENDLNVGPLGSASGVGDFPLWGTLIEMSEDVESDAEGDMEYTADEDAEEDNEDEEMEDNDSASELIESELPGLLMDAGLEIIDLTQQDSQQDVAQEDWEEIE